MCSGAASPSLHSEWVWVLPLNQRFGPSVDTARGPEQPGVPEASSSPRTADRMRRNSVRFSTRISSPFVHPTAALPGLQQRDLVELAVENHEIGRSPDLQP